MFRPGRHPLAALNRALVQAGLRDLARASDLWATVPNPDAFDHVLETLTPRGQVNLLVLDQFEELFTQAEPAQGDALIAILVGLQPFAQVQTHLIATLRADYLPALLDITELFRVAKACSIDLRAMTTQELGQAIRRPLDWQNEQLRADTRWQPELVDRLVADTAGQPALLPLLQVTQEAIWASGRLTLDRYGTLTDGRSGRDGRTRRNWVDLPGRRVPGERGLRRDRPPLSLSRPTKLHPCRPGPLRRAGGACGSGPPARHVRRPPPPVRSSRRSSPTPFIHEVRAHTLLSGGVEEHRSRHAPWWSQAITSIKQHSSIAGAPPVVRVREWASSTTGPRILLRRYARTWVLGSGTGRSRAVGLDQIQLVSRASGVLISS